MLFPPHLNSNLNNSVPCSTELTLNFDTALMAACAHPATSKYNMANTQGVCAWPTLRTCVLAELRTWCAEIGELPNRAMHLWRWMYYKNWIRSFSDTDGKTNAFSSAFVEKASRLATLDSGLHLQSVHTAADGTRKLLFSIDGGGQEQVETVLIPIVRSKVRSLLVLPLCCPRGCALLAFSRDVALTVLATLSNIRCTVTSDS